MKKLVCESLQEFYKYSNSIKNIYEQQKPIKNKKVKEIADKINNDAENEVEKPKNSKIKTVLLPSKRKGFECLAEIEDNDAFDHPGQGLYIWTNKSFLEAGKNYFKVGQYGAHGEAKTPDATIASYAGTTIDNIVIVYVVRLDDYLVSNKTYNNAHQIEKVVHKKITEKNKGYHVDDLGKSTELFAGLTLQDHIKIINGVLFNTERLKSFDMRPEQKTAHDQIVNNFNAGKKEFLLAAKMRYGKNFTFLNAAKTLGYKNILVLTYKPQVFSSLKEDIETHINFDGWKFVEFRNQRNLTTSKSVPQVIVSSAQLAQYKSDDDKENEEKSLNILTKNISALKPIHFDLIVADEYHYGTGTYNFKELLKQLNYDHIIWISGTAMKDIQVGRFQDEDVFVWDYIDEQKKKREGSKAHQDMPTMEMHLMYIDERAKAAAIDLYTPEEGFNMAKLITVNADGSLKNEGSLEILLRQIAGTEVRKEMSPFRSVAGLNHTFWVLDKNVNGIKAMAKLMRTMSEYKDCIILEATGDVVSNINTVKEKINKANNEGKRTITLSCYRFKEGVTVPEWNGVIMLDGGKSIEEYLQAIFRCQSPDPEHDKQKCHVFDFNPQRCLQMIYDTCENIDKTGKHAMTETIREFLDYAPILDHVNNKLNRVDFNTIIENFRAHGSFSEKFANTKNINIEKIDKDVVESLEGVVGGQRKKEFEVNDQDVLTGKTAISKRVPVGTGEEVTLKPSKNEVKKYIQKIQTVLSNIPEYLFNSIENEKTVDDILLGKDAALFKEITGISIEDFKRWNQKGLINTVLLNRNILNFYDAEEKFLNSSPGLEDKEKFFNQHFNMRAESGATPATLVNEMLDKLPADTWTDPKKTFCDPVMGTGTFLVAIKQRLMEGLKDKIPNQKEREKHILNNMIWGGDINKSKTLMTNKLINNISSSNIMAEDSLTRNWNMKFDVIVGNPPYQGEQIGGGRGSGNAIWYKFVELSFDILKKDGYLCCVHPCGWRMPPVSKKIEKARNLLINNQIDYLELYKTPFEGVNIVVDWYIARKILKYKETKIKYVNGIYENHITNDFILNYGGPLIESIKNKVLTIDDNGLKARKSFGGLTVLDRNKPKGKYKFAHGARFLKNEWTYFEYPHIYQYNPKVIISAVGPLKAIYDEGEIGIGDHVHYLLVKNKKEADFFIAIINSKLSKFFQKAFAGVELHKTYDLPARWNVPDPLSKIKLNTTQLKTDNDVYKYFNLTPEEIIYIESQVK